MFSSVVMLQRMTNENYLRDINPYVSRLIACRDVCLTNSGCSHLSSTYIWAATVHYTSPSRVIASGISRQRMGIFHSRARRVLAEGIRGRRHQPICIDYEQVTRCVLFRFGCCACAGVTYLRCTALQYCLYYMF